MPAERSRGSRRTGADGDQLVWTEPSVGPGIAFATTLTPGAFEESTAPTVSSFAVVPSKPKLEVATSPITTSFFFFDGSVDETKPKRASHKRKQNSPPSNPTTPSPTSPESTTTDAVSSPTTQQQHIPRPPNAFILFRSSFIRAGAVPSHIEPSHASLSAIAGMTWAALPAPEKALWHRKAKEERERHRERFPGYAFRPKQKASSPHEGDSEDGGGGDGTGGTGTPTKKRQQREIAPADRARQAHIATLLLSGLTGEALDEAIGLFDKERGQSVVEVRFGVVETPEGRMAGSEKQVVKRTTSRSEKRGKGCKDKDEVKSKRRTRVSSLPSSAISPAPPTSPFDFQCEFPSLDTLSMPSTPANDDFSFDWPYAGASSPATTLDFDSSYPPSPALSHSASCSSLASTPSSSWEDLSMAFRNPPPPSSLSACSSMSDLASLSSQLTLANENHVNAGCDAMGMMSMPLYGSLLQPPYELDLDLGLNQLGGQLGLGVGHDANNANVYLGPNEYSQSPGLVW